MKNKLPILSVLCVILLSLAGLFACGEKTPEETPAGSSCEHTFASFTIVTEPTESSFGKVKGRCSICGEEEEFFIPALNTETYEMTETIVGCEDPIERTYENEYGTFVVRSDPPGHAYVLTGEVPATCRAAGKKEYRCSRCGDTYERTLAQLDHKYEIEEESEGSCTEEGYVLYRCKIGGETYKKTTGFHHVYGEGVHTDVACPDVGYTTYVCADCGHTEIVYDAEPAHEYDEKGFCIRCGSGCAHVFGGYVCKKCGLNIETRVREDGYCFTQKTRSAGEKVWLGMFPQSVVSLNDVALLAALDEAEETDGYYTVDGVRYVKSAIDNKNKAVAAFSDGNYLASYKGSAYFRVEPVSWTVTKVNDDGSATLLCDKALFAFDYQGKGTFDFDPTREGFYVLDGDGFGDRYPDAYEGSDAQKSAEAFLSEAFTAAASDLLVETEWGKVTLPLYVDFFADGEDDTIGKETQIRKPTDYALGTGADVWDRVAGRGTYYRLLEKGTGDETGGVITSTGAYGTYPLYGEEGRNACFVPTVTLKGE